MISTQNQEYVKSLINTYKKQGYKYYLCCTDSDSDISTDIYLYLSKEEIKAISNTIFTINEGIRINIDTSSSNYNKYDVLTITDTIPGDLFTINTYETIYSNCKYETSDIILYPDIMLSNSESYDSIAFMGITSFMFVAIFLYLFIKNILRLRR